MSVIGSNILAGASGQGGSYNLTNSLRFRRDASAYLRRTFTTPTDGKKATYSVWLKRGLISAAGIDLLGDDGTGYLQFLFDSGNKFNLGVYTGTSTSQEFVTDAVYRDPSAWYHFVIAIDTTQATASNRLKVYVNGVQQSGTTTGALTQNANIQILGTSGIVQIGARSNYFDGYMTEINYVDGQALTPSSFGATSATTGVWQPKKYVGTYGTNGFYLPFTDNSALTTSSNVGLGKDFSGNGNYWTTNNISITSGSTYDSMTDVPTLTSATASNFAVLNPLDPAISDLSVTLSNGNLTASGTTYGATVPSATFQVPSTGKWYYETTYTTLSTVALFGIRSYSTGSTDVRYRSDGQKNVGGTNSSYGSSWTTGDVIGVAIDMDAGTVTFYKNNVSQGAISIPTPTATFDLSWNYVTYASTTFNANFGQRPFAYTPPTGFVALNTFNLPTPTIGATASTQANKYFDISLYTGNASALTVSGLGFSPDLVWIKPRDLAYQHQWYDTVRGALKRIGSSSSNAENTETETLKTFTSNGFTLGNDVGTNPASPVVAWNWNAGGSTVTNTSGSISSQVRANTSSGFSVVTYTGTGSNATVGHGLGVAPKMVIIKSRSTSDFWVVWQTALSGTEYLLLNSTNGKSTAATYFNSTTPSSTVFSLGSDSRPNGNGTTYVAYCFSEVAGYSKFGSYTGNGSSDGTFVYTGFRPRFVLLKADRTSNWILYDTARATYNVVNNILLPDSSSTELTSADYNVDLVSNGFKFRTAQGGINGSSESILYMAFAESPFKYANAR